MKIVIVMFPTKPFTKKKARLEKRSMKMIYAIALSQETDSN